MELLAKSRVQLRSFAKDARDPVWVLWLLVFTAPMLGLVGTSAVLSLRNFHIVAATIGCFALWRRGSILAPGSIRAKENILFGCALLLYTVASLSRFEAVQLNALDFSIFDLMLAASARGQWMFSPFHGYNIQVFHQSWVLYLLVPLKWLSADPRLLQLIHALLVWAPALLVRRLVRGMGSSEEQAFFAALTYLSVGFIAVLLNGGFRLESFYPLAVFAFLVAWQERSQLLLPGLLFLLAVKEDAPVYALGFGAYFLLFRSGRRRAGAVVMLLSLAVLAGDELVALHYREMLKVQPEFLQTWVAYGTSMAGIARGILSAPLQASAAIFTSGWTHLYAPMAFLPLLSPVTVFASLPGMVMLGTADPGSSMYSYGAYYPVVLYCLALAGFVEVGRKFLPPRLLLTLTLVAPLFNAGWPQVWTPDFLAQREIAQALPLLVAAEAQLICAQGVILPHLPPNLHARILDHACLSGGQGIALIMPQKSAYPLTSADLEERFVKGASPSLYAGERLQVWRLDNRQ